MRTRTAARAGAAPSSGRGGSKGRAEGRGDGAPRLRDQFVVVVLVIETVWPPCMFTRKNSVTLWYFTWTSACS